MLKYLAFTILHANQECRKVDVRGSVCTHKDAQQLQIFTYTNVKAVPDIHLVDFCHRLPAEHVDLIVSRMQKSSSAVCMV